MRTSLTPHVSSPAPQRATLSKTFALTLTLLMTPGSAQPSNTALLRAVVTANARRAQVEYYVKELKTTVRPPDPFYAESRRRYLLAYTLMNAFMAETAMSFTSGTNTTHLAKTAMEVDLTVLDFTEYASDVLFAKRQSISGLTHTSTILIDDDVSNAKHMVRINRRTANALLAELQWKPWADII
jgi:hypothetical protein